MSEHRFDPLAPQSEILKQRQEGQRQRQEEQRALVRAAFANAPGAVAWLRESLTLANAQPSYWPGLDAQTAAFNEGRRTAIRDLVAAIEDALQPPRAGA